MKPKDILKIWLLLMIVKQTSGVSYNQPKFCPNATWDSNATTFADNNTIGTNPYDIFIDTNNTIYVPDANNHRVVIWFEGNTTRTKNISVGSSEPEEIFVSASGDIYLDTSNQNRSVVSKWTLNSTTGIPVMYACQRCADIFVDISNTLYCSMHNLHHVVTQLLNDDSNTLGIVAGRSFAGNTSTMLNGPQGIFVDVNFDLYVADTYNNRIQLFRKGQLNATTVAGQGSAPTTISLDHPTSIILDADKNLFIVDSGNNRVIGSGPNGFHCIVGCNSSVGYGPNQLKYPWSLSFDNNGNIFVIDRNNYRIQKFILMTGLCSDNTTSDTTRSPVSMETTSNFLATATTESYNATINPIKIVSYNQPKFDQYASWSANAITFASGSTMGNHRAYSIFVDTNNIVYAVDISNGQIWVPHNNGVTLLNTVSGSLSYSLSIFVTPNGDIYVDSGNSSGQVNKWISNTSTIAMYVPDSCFGLFVDLNNVLYCSIKARHQVITRSLFSTSNAVAIVAGSGCNGFSSYELKEPHGIFVDINFDLYVADSGNNRIQLYKPGQINSTTIAGSTSANFTITLSYPIGIVLDADKNLFIVDTGHNRIVRSGPNGFHCIVGCYGNGSASNQLSSPKIMAFDSIGNILVTDYDNYRIQKFILLNNSLPISYNQPQFNQSRAWKPNATTFAKASTIQEKPYGIFVDTNNSVYVTDFSNNRIYIWFKGSNNLTRSIYSSLSDPWAIFVTSNGDIYVNHGGTIVRISNWTLGANNYMSFLWISDLCYGLFVDTSNTLYCSMKNRNRIVKRWLDDNIGIWGTLTTVAGTGNPGSALNELNEPHGIFVDTNFDLYVADSGNDRIQLYKPGQINGVTIAGNTTINRTITLNYPTGIVLDGDNYLFIVDNGNNRIIGSGLNGFQCVVGCNSGGSASNELDNPKSMAFDSYGNIFVTDKHNHRVQKFCLETNSCGKYQTEVFTDNDTYTSLELTTLAITTEMQLSSDTSSQSTFLSSPASSTNETTSIHSKHTSSSFLDHSTPISSTELATIPNTSPLPFVAPSCPNQNTIGPHCNTSSFPCDILRPCHNNGNCINTNTTTNGYICRCPRGFDGDQCQIDNRPCKPSTCWHNGTCNETSNTTFSCLCPNGWKGDHCESMVNYCEGVKCENNGVCQPLFLNYTCVCLGASYSGRHCEIVARSTVIRQTVTRSFAYIAILSLLLVIGFIVVMDILKYVFGIDPVKNERKKIRKAKVLQRARRPPVVQKFTYVDALPQ